MKLRDLFKRKYDINKLYVANIVQVEKVIDKQPFEVFGSYTIKIKRVETGVFVKEKNIYGENVYVQVTTGEKFCDLTWENAKVGEYAVNQNSLTKLKYLLKSNDIKKLTLEQIKNIENTLNTKAKKDEENFDA